MKQGKRNYFYTIEITSRDGKRRAVLSENIKRLLESVQIQESLITDEQGNPGQLTLSFKQMDYLPDDKALRPQDPKVFGELTNRSAAITDLRFDSEKGFTFVSKEEMDSGRTTGGRTQNRKNEPIVYLFQGGNYIDITWGYLEPYKARTRRFTIAKITAEGSGSGDAVTIQAYDAVKDFAESKSDQGITFIENEKKLSLQQVLFKLAASQGVKLKFDGKVINSYPVGTSVYDPERTKQEDSAPKVETPFTLPRGVNLKQYLDSLANEYDSYYTIETVKVDDIEPQPKFAEGSPEARRQFTQNLGKKQVGDIEEILVFSRVPKFFEKLIGTFKYRDRDGIVLAYALNGLEYPKDVKASATGGNSEELFEAKRRTDVLVENDTRPSFVSDRERQQFTLALGTNRVGSSVTSPAETEQSTENYASQANDELQYFADLNVTTIGDPEHKPGLIVVDNIGVRYSGEYRAVQVSHSISSASYVTQWIAKRKTIEDAGVGRDNLAIENEEQKVRREQLVIKD
jgi:hypothetical protein